MGTSQTHRLSWAIEALDLEPDDRVLEVGCGHGVAVTLAVECLDDGKITAIDRSPKMIEMARARNSEQIDAGRAEILAATTIERADLAGRSFDKAFAINVRAMWQSQAALETVADCLHASGRLHLFNQSPGRWSSEAAATTARTMAAAIDRDRFAVEEVLTQGSEPVSTVGVVARLR